MGVTKLHQADQSLFDKEGLCYWACEFMTTFKGDREQGAWADWQRSTYAQLREAGISFTAYQACYVWAKVQRGNEQTPLDQYAPVQGALAPNRLFRIAVYVGPSPQPSSGPNHEIMCVTGPGTRVLVFDANLGFYETHADDMPGKNNREAMEHELKALLYGDTPAGTIYDFHYRNIGPIRA